MSEKHEIVIDSIRVSLTNSQRVMILKEKDGDKFIPIWIGAFEAESIVLSLQEIEISRPKTHDLLKTVIHDLGAQLKEIDLSKIQENTFYAFLVIENQGQELQIDCRPSDAISLALRCHVPMYADSEVIDTAGIIPETDIRTSLTDNPDESIGLGNMEETVESDDRLSIFDNFFKSIDTDSESSHPQKPSKPEDSHPEDSSQKPDDPTKEL